MLPDKGIQSDYVPLTPEEQRSDTFYKMIRDQEIGKAAQIIGPGPFYCAFCGKKLNESGHMMSKFFMCEDAGEFTWGPQDAMERVEIDGTSYLVAGLNTSDEELQTQRSYYKMCADAHKRSAERRKEDVAERAMATNELKVSNDRREGRAG
jgi:hypothetical protein